MTKRLKFMNSEKVHHTRFFSMTTLKPAKNRVQPEKKNTTNPSSPLVGSKALSGGGSPDQKLFSMTLDEVVKEPEYCSMFLAFLENMNASEGLEFLICLESLRSNETAADADPEELMKEANFMCEMFIQEGSEKELNLSGLTRETIESKLASADAASVKNPSTFFQEARIEVFNMLGTHLYSQWLSSLH